MLILQTPNKYRILVALLEKEEGTKEEQLASLRKEYAATDKDGKTPYQACISECQQVGGPKELYSSICNCPHDCHGGRTVDIHEIVIVDEKVYEKLQETIEAREFQIEPGDPVPEVLYLWPWKGF